MPLLQEILEGGATEALLGLPFGDPLDQASILFRLRNPFHLAGDH